MTNYSKYKERAPQDTVLEIQRILNGMGLFPVLQWGENSYEGARSCRVTLHPTDYGTNGKGTDELYATASAYGELMERLENNILTYRDRGDDMLADVGFREFPDETERSIDEIVSEPDPFSAVMLPKMGFSDPITQRLCLKEFCALYGRSDGRLTTVPFADPVEGKIQQLPISFITEMTLSNGMAAGNTLEEAMVQAMSEIFERAVQVAMMRGEAVPPLIPEEEIKKYGFYSLIEQIHAEGNYRVQMLDCSMGKGWPVAGLMITDLKTGRFGIKLGAHPSFAVAVERTLTESLQGRNIENFVNSSSAGTLEQSTNIHNITNMAKVAVGYYPASMLSDAPGWEYRPWTRWEALAKGPGNSNRAFLKEMLALLKAEGLHPMVRDCSFLGFPCCFIVVPGFSEIYPAGKLKYRMIATTRRARRSWDHFPELSDDEEKRVLNLIKFNEYSVRDDQVKFMTARQLPAEYANDRVAAYLSLKRGDHKDAARFFRKLAAAEKGQAESAYYSAMAMYASVLANGFDAGQAEALVKRLCSEAAAQEVCSDVRDLEHIMERRFRRLNCFDCAGCALAGSGCTYPQTRDIVVRVMRAMKKENVSQEALLQLLSELYNG